MIYVLSKLFWFLAQPVNAIAFLSAVGLVLMRWGKRPMFGLRLLRGTALVFVVITVLPVGTLLLLPLENRFPKLDPLPEKVDGVIVLGGSLLPRISEGRGVVAMGDGAERQTTMLELARRYPNARVVFSAGDANILRKGLAEADLARRFVIEQGMDPDRFVFERVSRNTWENALQSKKLVDPKPGETWILVTSAYHMPRSVGIFRKVGWDVVACPVDYRTDGSPAWLEFRYLERIGQLDLALREYYGLAAYWVLGRLSTLFPGPLVNH